MSTTPLRFRLLDGEGDLARWDEVASGPRGSLRQCAWWAQPLTGYGVDVDVIGAFAGDELVGGALVRSIPVPVLRRSVADCLGGPLVPPGHEGWATPFVAALRDLGRRRRFIQVAVRFCADPAVPPALQAAFAAAGLQATPTDELPDAVVDLRDRDLASVAGGYHQGVRRGLARARRAGLAVEQLRQPDDLRAAYRAFEASAARKGFDDLRPWAAAGPVLARSAEDGRGAVLGVRHQGEVVAAIFVAHVGQAVEYVYGGYLDHAGHLGANQLLHHAAIDRALAGGSTTYRLGMVSDPLHPSGVDRFKLGFGATLEAPPPSTTWTRLPAWGAAIRFARRTGRAGRLAGSLRRHRIRTAERAGA